VAEETISAARELARQSYPPISDEVYARLKPALKAGGLKASRAQAEQLAYGLQAPATIPQSRKQPPKQPRRRRGDPPRERIRLRRGAPSNRRMRQLFGFFVSFWIDHTGAVPGVSYGGTTYGPFVRFAQKICGELANNMSQRGQTTSASDREYLHNLRDVVDNPVRVRTWLDAVLKSRSKKHKKQLQENKRPQKRWKMVAIG
jgi:hypothetical protein